MQYQHKAEVIKDVLEELLNDNRSKCSSLVKEHYPFSNYGVNKRKYTPFQMTEIFLRDGFIDRYAGTKLLFPGIFRILKQELPDEFPAHSSWKMQETHIIYWELFPTIDHIIPVARGGTDSKENWITTSMTRNSAKANWTIDEIGWSILQPGNLNEWDGLSALFLKIIESKETLRNDPYIKRWEIALLKAKNKGVDYSTPLPTTR